MKIKLILILFCFSITSIHAKPSFARMTNVQVDSMGNFTSPDLYHYMQAIIYYNRNDKGTAMRKFKFSAEFGGKLALKYIAAMYLDGDGVPKDLIKGQAWLRMSANRGDKESIKLLDELESTSSPEKSTKVAEEYENLKIHYGKTKVLDNVYKFYRRFRFQTLGRPNKIRFKEKNALLNELQIRRLVTEIKEFYIETNQNIGTVTQGEIITKDD